MATSGMVSLWVGNAQSRAALDAALLGSYSEDGDFLGSPFSRGVGIGDYDENFRERVYFQTPPRALAAFLAGSSYSDFTIPRFETLSVRLAPEDNCAVLLYDAPHAGATRAWQGTGVSLRLVGTVPWLAAP